MEAQFQFRGMNVPGDSAHGMGARKPNANSAAAMVSCTSRSACATRRARKKHARQRYGRAALAQRCARAVSLRSRRPRRGCMSAANSTLQARAIAAPLAGVRVIEWSHWMPAAFCARVLRDLGAQVLKLEPPGTGAMRCAASARSRPMRPTATMPLLRLSEPRQGERDARSVVIRKAPALFRRLIETADLLITSDATGLAELQLDGDTLRRIQPALVTLAVTPWATHAESGHDLRVHRFHPHASRRLCVSSGAARACARSASACRLRRSRSGARHRRRGGECGALGSARSAK